MNELAKIDTMDREDAISILGNSLYPGAKRESIELVLSYCRMNGMDPFLKPVHIVPTSVKVGKDKYEWRDVLMPGIADYRIKAARSGEYGGKSEPEFGHDVTATLSNVTVTFPAWCRITVRRVVQGHVREFVASERWMENYATAGRDTEAPNRMWLKRPYGQLAKCAEAQALRMAFPEFSAGYTAEEMEGRHTFEGTTIDAEPARAAPAASPHNPRVSEKPTNGNGHRTDEQWRAWLDKLRGAVGVVYTRQDVVEIGGRETVGDALAKGPQWVQREISAILAEGYARFPEIEGEAPDDDLPPIVGEQYVGAG